MVDFLEREPRREDIGLSELALDQAPQNSGVMLFAGTLPAFCGSVSSRIVRHGRGPRQLIESCSAIEQRHSANVPQLADGHGGQYVFFEQGGCVPSMRKLSSAFPRHLPQVFAKRSALSNRRCRRTVSRGCIGAGEDLFFPAHDRDARQRRRALAIFP